MYRTVKRPNLPIALIEDTHLEAFRIEVQQAQRENSTRYASAQEQLRACVKTIEALFGTRSNAHAYIQRLAVPTPPDLAKAYRAFEAEVAEAHRKRARRDARKQREAARAAARAAEEAERLRERVTLNAWRRDRRADPALAYQRLLDGATVAEIYDPAVYGE